MKKLYILFLSCVLSCLLPFMATAQGYEIKVKIPNLPNADVILGHHFSDKLYPDDTVKLDKKGYGVLTKKTKLPEGIYFLMTPSHSMVDIFITDNQNFSVETDTTNLFDNLKFKNSPENVAIMDYRKTMTSLQKKAEELQQKKKNTKDEAQLKQISGETENIAKQFKEITLKFIADNEKNFVGQFIKATQDIDVPDFPRDANGKVLDSLFQYKYYKAHFFDNFKISDARLLRTPLYDEKIMKYIEKVILQIPDSINKECDKLLTEAEKDKDVFRFMVVTLFNYYAKSQIMGFDAVYCHIAENWYIPKATFSDTAFINKTKENVKKLKPTLIGKIAPNFKMLWVPTEHFIQAKTDTAAANNPHAGNFIDINGVKANYTILAFWECDCGHCKKQIPELHEVYKKLKPKGVEALAIHMLGGVEGKKKWIKFVNEHQLYEWKNVWNPYDYKYKELYDIKSTPVLIVLDKDKKIIAKRLEPKQILEFLERLIEKDNKSINKK